MINYKLLTSPSALVNGIVTSDISTPQMHIDTLDLHISVRDSQVLTFVGDYYFTFVEFQIANCYLHFLLFL